MCLEQGLREGELAHLTPQGCFNEQRGLFLCSWRLSLLSCVPECSGEGWNVCVSKPTVTDLTYPAEWREMNVKHAVTLAQWAREGVRDSTINESLRGKKTK